MTELRRLGPDDWEAYRDVRLRSLADAPDAFHSTLARERGFTEAEWRQRLGVPVLVVCDPDPVAMGGLIPQEPVVVWGMWTDPAHRRRGHARRLLEELLRGVGGEVVLHVNTANAAARSAYEQLGFVGTGEVEPLREGSDQIIELMRRPPVAPDGPSQEV